MYANDFHNCTVYHICACVFIYFDQTFFRVTEDEESNVNSHYSSTIQIQDEMQLSRGSKNRSEDSTCGLYVTSNGVSGIDNMLAYNGTNAAMAQVLSSSIVEDKSSDIDVSQSDDCLSSYSEKSQNDSICDSGFSNSLKDESLSKRVKSKMLQIHLQKLVISDYGGCVENSRKLVDMSFRDLERKREKNEMRRRRRLKRRIEREQKRYSELSRDMEKQRLKNQMEGSNHNERTSIDVSQDIKSGCDDIKPVVEDRSHLEDNGISGCRDYPSPIYKKVKKVHKSKKHKNRKLLVPLDLFEMPKATPPSVSPSSGKSENVSSSSKKSGTVSSPCKKSGNVSSSSKNTGSMSSSPKKLGTVSSPCKKSGIIYSPSNKSGSVSSSSKKLGSMSSSSKKLGTVSSPCKKSGTVSSSCKKSSLSLSVFQDKGSSSMSSSPSHSKKMVGVPSNEFKGTGGMSSSPNGPIGMSVSSSKSKGSSDHIQFKGSGGMSPNPSQYKKPVAVSSAPSQSKGLESSKYKRSVIVSSTSSPFKSTKCSGSKSPVTMPSDIIDKSLSSPTSVEKRMNISSKSTSRSQKLLSPSRSDGSGNVLSNYSRSKGSVNFLSSPSWSDNSVNLSSPSRTKDSLGAYSSPSSDSSVNMFSSLCHDIDSTDTLSSPSQSKKSGSVFTFSDGSVNVLSGPSCSKDSDNISSSQHEDVLSTYTPSEGVFSNLSRSRGQKDVLHYDYSPKCVESLDNTSKQLPCQTDIDEIDDVFSDRMEKEMDAISGDDEEEIKRGTEEDGNMDLDAPALVSVTSSIFSLK